MKYEGKIVGRRCKLRIFYLQKIARKLKEKPKEMSHEAWKNSSKEVVTTTEICLPVNISSFVANVTKVYLSRS